MHKFIPLLSAIMLASPVFAANWVVDPLTSRLMFEGEQASEKLQGSFGKFTSAIEFDEAAPEQGKIAITIDMTSAQIDGKDRMDSLPTDDWFATKKFAVAQFVSTSIRALGNDKTGINSYEATGHLTIRGISKEITLPFSLKTTGNSTLARGNVTLNRSDYNVGIGQWKSDEWVKFPVHVSFELRAQKTQ